VGPPGAAIGSTWRDAKIFVLAIRVIRAGGK